MAVAEHERLDGAGLDPRAPATQQLLGRVGGSSFEVPRGDRQRGARREPDQVDGVREQVDLVEIVDAPAEPTVVIAPGAEVLDVKVADRDRLRRAPASSGSSTPNSARNR